jgi:hypothetical protein
MQKGLLPVLTLVALVAAALFGIQQSTAGGAPVTSGPPLPSWAVPPTGAQKPLEVPYTLENRKLHLTTIAYNDRGRTMPPGEYEYVHRAVTMNCPRTPTSATCTLNAEMFIQFAAGTSGDDWAVCLVVDGIFAWEPACGWFETNSVAGEVSARSFSQSMSALSPGEHAVQAFGYSTGGGRITEFTVRLEMYTP